MTKIKTIISIIAIFSISYIVGVILVNCDIKYITIDNTLILTGLGASTICCIFFVLYPLYTHLNEYFEDKKPKTKD